MTKIFYSPRIKEIIDFMAVYYDEHECFPKLDEIGKGNTHAHHNKQP